MDSVTTTATTTFELLGRFEVRVHDRAVAVGPLKQRCLLALLALRPGTVVSREEIVDTLWSNDPPASCLNLVHTYVSRLRRQFWPALVASERGGYRLTAAPEHVDVWRFASHVELARDQPAERALPLYEQALRLWRGPALADLPDELRQHPAALAAASQRIAAAVAYGDAALELGRAGAAVELLRAVGHDEPLHEGLHARLMLALAGSGQQAAALQLFTAVRDRLAAELGVEPSAEITSAHLRVLRQDLPSRRDNGMLRPAQLPANVSGFAGRADHLAQLDETGGLVVISGTAGVGKTALAVHWAHQARDRFPDGQLYANLRGYAPGLPMRPMEALTRFLRALGVAAERLPADEDEAVGLYRTLLTGRRVLVVLDNAADADQVRLLLPGSSGCAAVVTSRDRLTGLMATDGARLLHVDVLAEAEARALLAGLLGEERVRAERAAVDELARTCAYLPLALRIAAANLSTQPHTSIAGYPTVLRERGRVDELAVARDQGAAVRIAFDLSYTRLEPLEQRLFRLLGLVPGTDYTAATAAALSDVPEPQARSLLAGLAHASLLTEHTAGRYQCHDLLREYAASRAAAEEPDEGQLAALTRYADYLLHTADRASRQLDQLAGDQAAAAWLDVERANLVAVATSTDPRLRSYSWRFADVLRGYFARRGHGPDGLAMCTAALEAAMLAGDTRAQAAVHGALGAIHYNLSSYAKAITHHERALELHLGTDDLAGVGLALHSLGRVYSQLGRPGTAARHHEQALDISRRTGDARGKAMALNYVGVTALSLGRTDEALHRSLEALRLGHAIGDADVQTRSLHALGVASWARGDLAQARMFLTRCRKHCEDTGDLIGLAGSFVSLADTACDVGDYRDAAKRARIAVELGSELGERRHEISGLELLGTASLRSGEVEAATRHYTQALHLARAIGFGFGQTSILLGLAAASRAAGLPADAVARSREALGILAASGMRLLEAPAFTELAAGLLALGELRQAVEYAERAVTLAHERSQRLAEGRARLVLGLARDRMGDRVAARTQWESALSICVAIGTPEAVELSTLLS